MHQGVEQAIQHAAQIMLEATHTVILTGAGISTASGIPDFRSPDSGLWTQPHALETASIFGFKRNPHAFYQWMRPLAQKIIDAQPNPAHLALAKLEQAGYIQAIITQNIDMLHARAGSQKIYELHGDFRRATCIECFTEIAAEPLITRYLSSGDIPYCQSCGGVIKPNVILFGEQLPVRELLGAKQAARQCDLMIVIGSSLEVSPAGGFPMLAQEHGAKLVIINYQETYIDSRADILLRENAAEVVPMIAAAVMEA
ncbi:MAG: NAD-dependent deacylase [Anaerolineae bacterium]|nr:NAD-dependent deacylase [Anaerolineae bacterium]